MTDFTAAVVGSGPNGLSAAIRLAQAGHRVVVYEMSEDIGGGLRSAPLTLPGFLHDTCSSVHPMGISSPFWATLPLMDHGLEWLQPELPVAHPLDDGSAVLLHRSVEETAEEMGCSTGAVRGLLQRAKANLRDAMERSSLWLSRG